MLRRLREALSMFILYGGIACSVVLFLFVVQWVWMNSGILGPVLAILLGFFLFAAVFLFSNAWEDDDDR